MDQQEKHQEQATYLTLIGIFLGLFAAFSKREQEQGKAIELTALDLSMLALTTFRAGQLATYDKVAEPLRAPFTDTKPDTYGTGETTVPEGSGVRRAIGSLLSCPICVGTWVSAFLVYGLRIAPIPTRLFLAFMSSIGLAQLVNSANEALTWASRAERKQAKPSR